MDSVPAVASMCKGLWEREGHEAVDWGPPTWRKASWSEEGDVMVQRDTDTNGGGCED